MALQPKILFQDAALIALDKPAGLLSHGAEDVTSALTWLQAHVAAKGGDPALIHLVHRLDKETSGVLLFACTDEAARLANEAFRERRVLKVYLALTSPVPGLRWQRADLQLKPRKIGGGEFMAVVPDDGLTAAAEVEVLGRGRRFGLVRVIPEQGRKHQVRATLAALGAPICGDFLYGGPIVKKLAPRTMLHARALELKHPVTGEHLVVRAPLPADFRVLIQEDGGILPSDLDRRHRTAPLTDDRARRPPSQLVQQRQADRQRAQAGLVTVPRGVPGFRPTIKPKAPRAPKK
jgi:RluA family pseudouridine synthase